MKKIISIILTIAVFGAYLFPGNMVFAVAPPETPDDGSTLDNLSMIHSVFTENFTKNALGSYFSYDMNHFRIINDDRSIAGNSLMQDFTTESFGGIYALSTMHKLTAGETYRLNAQYKYISDTPPAGLYFGFRTDSGMNQKNMLLDFNGKVKNTVYTFSADYTLDNFNDYYLQWYNIYPDDGSKIVLDTITIELISKKSIKIGEYIQMGKYYDEPILWRCVDIDENGPLMIADKILTIKPFDAPGTHKYLDGTLQPDFWNNARTLNGSNIWETSSIRSWLNSTASAGNVQWLDGCPPSDSVLVEGNDYATESGFLSEENFSLDGLNAIKSISQKSILYNADAAKLKDGGTTTHLFSSSIASVVQNYDTTAYYQNVTEKMFVLNVKQINKVYKNSNILGANYYIGKPTRKAVINSEYKSSNLNTESYWESWLSTPNAYSDYGNYDRKINSNGDIGQTISCVPHVGVRPAFYLNFSAVDFKSGNGLSMAPYEISNDIAPAPELPIKIGEYVQMGTYYNEPILWRCVDVDENGPLMLSDRILTVKPFDAPGTHKYLDGTVQSEYNNIRSEYGSNLWQTSNIRSWLNSTATAGNVQWLDGCPPTQNAIYNGWNDYATENGFLAEGNFTQSENNAIKNVTQKFILNSLDVDKLKDGGTELYNYHSDMNDVVKNYDKAFYQNVTDKIFLLNIKQLNMVYQNTSLLGQNYFMGKPTQKAVDNTEFKDSPIRTTSYLVSWLSTPIVSANRPADIRSIWYPDSIYENYTNYYNVGVRPAFYLDLSSTNFRYGAGSTDNPYVVDNGEILEPTPAPTATPTPTETPAPTAIPTPSGVKGNFAVISNESTSETAFASTGTFSLAESNPLLDDSLDMSAYRMDYVKPFNENIIAANIKFNFQTLFTVYNVGDTRYFYVYNIYTNSYSQITATLKSSGTKSNVWVKTTDYNMSTTDANKITAEFDNNISPKITSVFGQPSDIDSDSKVNILCFDIKDGFSGSGGYVAGYFDPSDLYQKNSFNPYSNQTEVFYIDTYPAMGTGSTKDVTKCYDTVAHEFQHMVNWNRNVFIENNTPESLNTNIWLQEALSEAASQVYSGQVSQSRIDYYNSSSTITSGSPLLKWESTLDNYSLSYLFSQYLKLQVGIGDAVFTEIVLSSHNDYQAVEDVIKKYIDPGLTFGRFMTYFRVALLLKRPTGLYGFKGNAGYGSIAQKIYSGSAINLYGGGAVVIASNPTTGYINIPANKGATINYFIVQNLPVISLSTYLTAPTNQNITITASTDVGTMNEASHTFTENGSFDFMATDIFGYVSTKTVTITNIDKTAPSAPALSLSTIQPTNSGVTVTFNYPGDAAVKVFKTENGSWINYAIPLTLYSNETIYTKCQDLAGNWSNIGSIEITNIDKVAPIISGVANNVSYTAAMISFNEGTATLNGLPFSNGSIIRTAGNYQLVVTDAVGNATNISFTINNTPYNYSNGNISGIVMYTKISEMESNLNIYPGETIKIFGSDNGEITQEMKGSIRAATGMYVQFLNGISLVSTKTIVIYGDVSGDGIISINDIVKMKQHLLKITQLTGAYSCAGDLSKKGSATISDLLTIKKHLLGIIEISQCPGGVVNG